MNDDLYGLLGTWSEAYERRDMLHLYKENGTFYVIIGRHGEQDEQKYEIAEIRLINSATYILRCQTSYESDGRNVISEKLIFIRDNKSSQNESYGGIDQLYDNMQLLDDNGVHLYRKDPNLTYPLEDEFPYSLPVLDKVTDEQLCAAIGGYYEALYSEGSIKIELRDGKAVFTMNNANGYNGEYILESAYESIYYRAYKLTLKGSDGEAGSIFLRPGFTYDRFAILNKIDDDRGSTTYYKR